jgi:hypothetical protein
MVLEKKLTAKNIEYSTVEDVDLMISKGFDTMPMLEIDGKVMDFKAANTWINEQ